MPVMPDTKSDEPTLTPWLYNDGLGACDVVTICFFVEEPYLVDPICRSTLRDVLGASAGLIPYRARLIAKLKYRDDTVVISLDVAAHVATDHDPRWMVAGTAESMSL